MEAAHLYELIQNLREIFDVVRLVDTDRMEICDLNADGTLTREKYSCYAIWSKNERCMNCISAKACALNDRLEKFEFVNGEIYHVVSKCVTVEGTRYALEVATRTNDETLFEAYGKGEFVKAICDMNEKMYVDSLTGLKNRRYYDEQKCRLARAEAMALIDLDEFKQINDTYGHPMGDLVLKAVAQAILSEVRKTDTVIRYGGDEIYVVFQEMQKEHFARKLQTIRDKVLEVRIPALPELRISVSIGGFYRGNAMVDPFELVDRKMYQAKKDHSHVVI